MSRDVDVLGDRETLTALAKVIGAKPQFFPLKPPTNEIGVVIAHDATGQPLLVEVLRTVHGVTNHELSESAYAMALGERKIRVQVPDPITLLKAKIANVADLAQSGRQDARHVVILAQLMPAFLADLVHSCTQGRLDERGVIKHLENLLSVVTEAKAKRVLAGLKITPSDLFSGLSAGDLPKVAAFVTKRLPRLI